MNEIDYCQSMHPKVPKYLHNYNNSIFTVNISKLGWCSNFFKLEEKNNRRNKKQTKIILHLPVSQCQADMLLSHSQIDFVIC